MIYVLPKLALIGSLIVAGADPIVAQENYFTNWPAGSAPEDVGKRLAEHFVTSPHQYGGTLHYSEAAAWYGALSISQLTHDDALRDRLIKRFEPLMPGGAESTRVPTRHHVDDSIFGIVPLEIAIETKDEGTGTQFHAATVQWRTPSGKIGWVQVTQSPMIDAAADEHGLTISATGTIRLRIHATGMQQTKVGATAWELPGLRVAVASDAKSFSVEKAGDAIDLIYSDMTKMRLDITTGQ